jgi:hypothetical protein
VLQTNVEFILAIMGGNAFLADAASRRAGNESPSAIENDVETEE